MLVLSRRIGDVIHIGNDVFVVVLDVSRYGEYRFGISAPRDVEILRGELLDANDPRRLRAEAALPRREGK